MDLHGFRCDFQSMFFQEEPDIHRNVDPPSRFCDRSEQIMSRRSVWSVISMTSIFLTLNEYESWKTHLWQMEMKKWDSDSRINSTHNPYRDEALKNLPSSEATTSESEFLRV
jgi:hypothetical protein